MNYAIVDKIVGLQRMAEPGRGATDAERATASAMASRLMAKHDVTQLTVDVRRRLLETPTRYRHVPPRSRAGDSSRRSSRRPRYNYRMNATLVAEMHGLDARKFRAWLRKQGIVGEKRDEIFKDEAKAWDLVKEFQAR